LLSLKEDSQLRENVGFEVLTAVIMKSTIFWDITPCRPLSQPTFRRKISIALIASCFHADFFLDLFFYPEDGGDMFLRNVGRLSTDYMALCPRR
jgi:hypothetical protein